MMDSDGIGDDVDTSTYSSVVLHVDLDCFYAAVEHVRLGIPKEVPLAVQQWEGLIAVNYAARAVGITRHERANQALKKCPELQCVHVETIGEEGCSVDGRNRSHAKVSLERYRQASASVFVIFHRFSSICEKASIDEAYLDVTREVEKMVNEGCNWDEELYRLVGKSGAESEMVVVDGPLVPFNSFDRRMLAGAIIAERIRSSVRNELGYTCSVGIATNKLVAKIASAKNKPDKQTLIPPRAVPGLMQTMPLKKVKLLGGKLGEELTKKWGFVTAGEAQALPLSTLTSCFGERLGNYVWHAVRGIQADKVQAKQVPKSMLAAKTFQSTKELSDIRRWLSILAEELSVRMIRDFQQNHRHPRLLQMYYRSGNFRQSKDHTKSWAMPHAALNLLSASLLPSHQQVLESCKQDMNPELKDEHQQVLESCKQDMDLALKDEQECKADLVSEEESLAVGQEQNHAQDLPSAIETAREDQPKELLGLVVTEKSRNLAKVLEDAAYNMFERLQGTFPCTRLALAAGGFQDLPAQGTKSIQHFFSNTTVGKVNSGPQQSNDNCRLRELNPAISPKAKSKGLLKYLTPETSSILQEDRRGDIESGYDRSYDYLAPDVQRGTTKGKDETVSTFPGEDIPGQCGARMEDSRASPLTKSTPDTPKEEAVRQVLSASVMDNRKADEMRNQDSENRPFAESHDNYVTAETSGRIQVLTAVNRGRESGPVITDSIDLTQVDIKEQCRILAAIQRSSEEPSKPGKRGRQSGSSQIVQPPISKFFRSQNKPSDERT